MSGGNREAVRAVVLSLAMIGAMLAVAGGVAGPVAADDHVVVVDATEGEGDYDTIQEAVDNADENDVIEVADGTYTEEITVDVDGVTLRPAENADPTVLAADSVGGGGAVITITADEVTVKNLQIVEDQTGEQPTAVRVNGDNADVVGNVISTDNTGNPAIGGDGVSPTIDANEIAGGPIGGGFTGDVTITENTIEGTVPDEAVWLSGSVDELTVTENDITGVETDDTESGSAELKLTEEPTAINGESVGSAGDAAIATLTANTGTATVELWTGDVYDQNGNVLVQAGESIQDAVDAASDGETIAVADGVYQEDVTIDGVDGLTLTAAESSTPVVEGDLRIGDESGEVGADATTIANLSFEDASKNGEAIRITASENVLIENNEFDGYKNHVQLDKAGGDPVDIAIVGNEFRNATDGGTSIAGTEDVSGLNIIDNTFDNNRNSIGIGSGASDVTIVENQFTDGEFYLTNREEDLDLVQEVLQLNEFDQGVGVETTNDATRNQFDGVIQWIATDVQAGVDTAEANSSVTVVEGTYEEDITVNTANVSVVGFGDETVIDGQVTLNAEGSSVSDLRVTASDDFDTTDNDPVVLVQANDTSVERLQIDGITGDGVNTVDVIQVFNTDDAPVTDVFIYNNTIEDIESDGVVGVSAIKTQGNLEEIFIFENEIDQIHSEGWAYGVVTTPSSDEPNQKVSDVVIDSNSIETVTADEFAGVGVGIDTASGAPGTDGGLANETFVSANNIQNNDISLFNKDVENTLFAQYNYFGSEAPTVEGDVIYDPFLTVEPDDLEADSPSELRDFGHDLVVPADGDVHSVAFPAPVEGTVSEVFDDFEGTVYAYDGDEWVTGSEIADEEIGALDAFAVSVDESEDDLRIAFEYAGDDSEFPSMTTAELDEGWNFVGAPESGPSTDAFAAATADVTTVVDALGGADPQTVPYGLTGSGDVANPTDVSPFQGYWVFVTDDGELGATVPVDPAQETEEGALRGR